MTELPWERLLPRVGAAVARRHRRLLAAHGLTPTSAALLDALRERDGQSHRELAGRLELTPATLTPVVDALVGAGALRRERDGRDRRVVRLRITDTGRARLRTADGAAVAALREVLPEPPPGHAGPVRAYLGAVLVALDDGR